MESKRSASSALLALMAERELVNAASDHVPHVPETMQPRLGDYLLRHNLLTDEDLERALAVQTERKTEGQPQRLGQTLLDLELLTREDLDQAIMAQVLELHAALQASNEQLSARVAERTRQLKDALDKLTELSQQKANFISNISHELRTPLAHLSGYIALLTDGTLGDLGDDQLKALDICDRSLNRLGQLIEDLIRFADSAKGELQLELMPIAIQPLVNRIIVDNRTRAENAQVTLESRLPDMLPLVQADSEKIGWVLYQLIDNAIKFNRPKGKVQISAEIQNDKVRLIVADTGIGITKEEIQDIFMPFHQLDGSSTRRYGGTGLGLALARRIAEMHHTELKVRSLPGKGSAFSLDLPVANP